MVGQNGKSHCKAPAPAQRPVVWILTREPTTGAHLGELVEKAHGWGSRVGRSINELADRLDREAPPAVFVDIDPDPERLLAELEPVADRFQSTRFLVLASNRTDALVMAAMQAGARHFLLKQNLGDELPQAMERLNGHGGRASDPRGGVISILSAGGGCGATTLAVNLAAELGALSDGSCLLVDLDDAYGSVASYLDLEARFSVADVLGYGEHIDAQLIRSSAAHVDGFQVLVSRRSVSFADSAPVAYEHLGRFLDACESGYRWVVLDAPRLPVPLLSEIVRRSHRALLCTQLTVKDIRTARRLRDAIAELSGAPDSIRCLANRYRKRGMMIGLEEASAALRGQRLIPIRNDFRRALKSVELGEPLRRSAPRCAARRDIHALARQFAGGDLAGARPADRSGG